MFRFASKRLSKQSPQAACNQPQELGILVTNIPGLAKFQTCFGSLRNMDHSILGCTPIHGNFHLKLNRSRAIETTSCWSGAKLRSLKLTPDAQNCCAEFGTALMQRAIVMPTKDPPPHPRASACQLVHRVGRRNATSLEDRLWTRYQDTQDDERESVITIQRL